MFRAPVESRNHTNSVRAVADVNICDIQGATLFDRGATSEVSTEELRQILVLGSALFLDTRSHLE
jgi:hypothetical protein